MDQQFWKNKRVFLTGHTGFKGTWLGLWLNELGAEVFGYALAPPTQPSLYELCGEKHMDRSEIADIRQLEKVSATMAEARPEIVIHMAAQPIVRESYRNPVETYAINVMGTVNLLEAVRHCPSVKAVLVITTDKCYENREWPWGYREDDRLGGYDPYSNSKACSEQVVSAYRRSFFSPEAYSSHGVAIATARAGNVIGGGDWAADRLIPDCIGALSKGDKIVIRNPNAIRPWQHVLEPLSGYLMLAQRLYSEGTPYGGAWNFGPNDDDAKPVGWIVDKLCRKWGREASFLIDQGEHPHEANYLKLDCSKAKAYLGWRPQWDLDDALNMIIQWTDGYGQGKNVREICLEQIREYTKTMSEG